MVVNRFSGGAVAALQGAAGVNQASDRASTTVDPVVLEFEQSCARLGLAVRKQPVRSETAAAVWASQWPLARAYWWIAGFYDDISVYTIELAGGAEREGSGYPGGHMTTGI